MRWIEVIISFVPNEFLAGPGISQYLYFTHVCCWSHRGGTHRGAAFFKEYTVYFHQHIRASSTKLPDVVSSILIFSPRLLNLADIPYIHTLSSDQAADNEKG